ncbi:MAG TPA: DUF4105 domain-containing protein [Elusimicrobiales bacterium]|nr:DUF4105 domain-containing protein [Elusimicrobiales bacterium]
MKNKTLLLALTAVTVGAFAYNRPANRLPSDLRDAVAEVPGAQSFDTDIPAIQKSDKTVPAPKAAAVGRKAKRLTGTSPADPVLNALTDAQWNNILGTEPWEDTIAAEDQGANKELFGDFHNRYIAKGKVSFATNPPTFTTESGKVFKVVKYPKWLKEVGDTKICVEGYAKQRDDTSEFIIKKMLQPSALDNIMPAADMQNIQRDPVIIAQNASGYVLGNVNWNLKHDSAGVRVKDQYGNFISEWQSGVKVNADLLESSYFVKKTTLKPIRYGDHGFLMFKFKPGGVTTADGKTTRIIVVSLDAYYKDQSNMSYSPISALKGKYLVYYSIQSTERYCEFKMEGGNQSMTMYPLRLTHEQQRKLLDNAFKKATDNNKGEAYSLFYNSCANSALSIVNSVLEGKQKIKAGWLPEIVYRLKTTLPDSITGLLLRKHIAEKPLPEMTLENYRTFYDF